MLHCLDCLSAGLAVQAAGLSTQLDAPSLSATVFAPTDAAFEKLLLRLGTTAAQLLNETDLLGVVSAWRFDGG